MNCQDYRYRHADPLRVTRRWFFEQCGVGLASIALGQLFEQAGHGAPGPPGATNPLAPKAPHFAPKAKRVLYLFMAGAPSHLELFDNKPQLAKFDGTLPPPELIKGYRAAFINPSSRLLGPKFKFARYGQSGAELSELLPHFSGVVDDIAIVHSMVTDAFNHAPGQIMMNTGSQIFGRPSLGAWVCYGLGSESQDLPAFVVFSTGKKGTSGGNSNFGSGFLPTVYQGVQFRSSGDPVLYLSNPRGVDAELQKSSLDAVRQLDHLALERVGDPEIATRISSYEMAFRMQQSAPEVMDIAQRAAACPRDVRRSAGQVIVCQHVPVGPANAGARSADGADLSRVVGPAQRAGEGHQEELRRDRQGLCGARSSISSSADYSTTRS